MTNDKTKTLVEKISCHWKESVDRYVSAKDTFLEAARVSPAMAIEWSESMLIAQYESEAWAKLAEMTVSSSELCEVLLDDILSLVNTGYSTNQFYNLCKTVKLKATRNVYRVLQCLINQSCPSRPNNT